MEKATVVPSAEHDSAETLRAKYLDYCSAQLADLLLYLSPDEMYLLAQRAARESDEASEASYDRIVQVAMRWLSRKVRLPPFEVWVEDYRKHPERYEEYFMGFWEFEAPSSDPVPAQEPAGAQDRGRAQG